MIFIAGATGFVGGHLMDFLLQKKYSLRCLVRSDKAGKQLLQAGAEVVHGDITNPDTLKGLLHPDDLVIHLVGIIEEKGDATFASVHVEGTRALIAEAGRAGVRHFFYQSALGADLNSWSGYLRTKAEAEEIVKKSGIPYTIFRPSLIIGPWDGFTRKIMDMLRFSPVVPLPGEGKARFQPVSIKDWLACIGKVIENPADFSGTFEIGGPEHLSYRQIVETLSRAAGYHKPVFSIPIGLMKLGASIVERFLPSPPVTSDQLRLLEQDNICDSSAIEEAFGFEPERYEDAVRRFVG